MAATLSIESRTTPESNNMHRAHLSAHLSHGSVETIRRLSRRLFSALAAFVIVPVIAATDTSPPTADNDSGTAGSPELSEVVVYARHRTESIQDAPLAVSVRTGDELHEQSADLIEDVGRDIPNVYMVSSPQSVNALNITMRGQSVSRSAIDFDSAVGVYVDGVYVADAQGAMSTLLDVDSVEVVRGSQGTLFGRNNTGGAVLFYTHRPDLTADSAEVAISGGDYREFMARTIVNLPVSSRQRRKTSRRRGWMG